MFAFWRGLLLILPLRVTPNYLSERDTTKYHAFFMRVWEGFLGTNNQKTNLIVHVRSGRKRKQNEKDFNDFSGGSWIGC